MRPREIPHDRQLRGPDVSLVWAAVANHYGVDPEVLGQRSRNTEIRSVAAWLAQRHTATTLGELASWLGLGRAQSASNLTRRVDESLTKSKALRRTIQQIQTQLADWQQEKPKPRPGQKEKLDLTPSSPVKGCGKRDEYWKSSSHVHWHCGMGRRKPTRSLGAKP